MPSRTARGGTPVKPPRTGATLRTVPPRRSPSRPSPSRPSPSRQSPDDRYSVPDSRSVRSPWVWRAFFVMSLLAFGVAIILVGNHKAGFAVAWGVIGAGWLAISMWLWRQHTRLNR